MWKVLPIKSFKEQLTATLTELCIVTSNPKTYSLIRMEPLSLLISVLLVLSDSPLKPTLMKLSLSGIELLKFFSAKSNTQLQLIFGQLVVFLQKWHRERLYLLETQKSIKSLKSSKFREPLTNKTGQLLWSCPTSSQPSPSGKEFLFLNTLRI